MAVQTDFFMFENLDGCLRIQYLQSRLFTGFLVTNTMKVVFPVESKGWANFYQILNMSANGYSYQKGHRPHQCTKVINLEPGHSSKFLDIGVEDFMDLTSRDTHHAFDKSSKLSFAKFPRSADSLSRKANSARNWIGKYRTSYFSVKLNKWHFVHFNIFALSKYITVYFPACDEHCTILYWGTDIWVTITYL